MKKLAILFIGLLALAACKTEQKPAADPVKVLDVESLNKDVDLNMDISQLSLSDLYVLRHVFLAQKGYPFEDSYLRSTYSATTWYDSLMWAFDESDDYFDWKEDPNDELSWRQQYYGSVKPEAIAYTAEQQAFVDRIKAREDELLKLNFKPEGKGEIVNMANLLNPDLLQDPQPQLFSALAQHGFAIVPAQHQQLFHVYEQNDYHEFPSFVTTDLYLQLFHLYFDFMLRDVEQHKLHALVDQFCREARRQLAATADTDTVDNWLDTYFYVATSLLEGKEPTANADAIREYSMVMGSQNDYSEFLGYTEVPFEYCLFKPRGHYTRNDSLSHYFRAMMWLQTVPFQMDREPDFWRAHRLAKLVGGSRQLTALYKQLTEPMTWLMGEPDDVSILQMWQFIEQKPDIDMGELEAKVAKLAERQTRIRPVYERTGRTKVRLMPQRYQPDAEVLLKMVDYETLPTRRDVPKGLDVLAAMGVAPAERILIDELGEADRWSQYKPSLQRMKLRMDSIDWSASTAVQWMSVLKTVVDKPGQAPYFMLTNDWDRKSLNAALASWTELKHDAILYAKQPYGAECGGAGPPDPVVKGYVEPNVTFWQRAIDLLKQIKTVLDRYNLTSKKLQQANEALREEAEFLLSISQRELKGEPIKDVEYDQIGYIGAAFENMSLELLRDADHELWDWEAVQGPDRKVALVADVYTANADNNDNKSVLYEAIGDADEIYVVVEIDGYLHLMRGAVFSYREFKRPVEDQRLTDEEWQQYLEQHPREGVPSWMKPIIVPLDKAPVDNESVFYSSGC